MYVQCMCIGCVHMTNPNTKQMSLASIACTLSDSLLTRNKPYVSIVDCGCVGAWVRGCMGGGCMGGGNMVQRRQG